VQTSVGLQFSVAKSAIQYVALVDTVPAELLSHPVTFMLVDRPVFAIGMYLVGTLERHLSNCSFLSWG
jgi:hypothetical protein